RQLERLFRICSGGDYRFIKGIEIKIAGMIRDQSPVPATGQFEIVHQDGVGVQVIDRIIIYLDRDGFQLAVNRQTSLIVAESRQRDFYRNPFIGLRRIAIVEISLSVFGAERNLELLRVTVAVQEEI